MNPCGLFYRPYLFRYVLLHDLLIQEVVQTMNPWELIYRPYLFVYCFIHDLLILFLRSIWLTLHSFFGMFCVWYFCLFKFFFQCFFMKLERLFLKYWKSENRKNVEKVPFYTVKAKKNQKYFFRSRTVYSILVENYVLLWVFTKFPTVVRLFSRLVRKIFVRHLFTPDHRITDKGVLKKHQFPNRKLMFFNVLFSV